MGFHREKVGMGERGEVSASAPLLGSPPFWREWSRSRKEEAGEGPRIHSTCPVQLRVIIKVFISRYYYRPDMCQPPYLCILCYLYLITTPMKTLSLFYTSGN